MDYVRPSVVNCRMCASLMDTNPSKSNATKGSSSRYHPFALPNLDLLHSPATSSSTSANFPGSENCLSMGQRSAIQRTPAAVTLLQLGMRSSRRFRKDRIISRHSWSPIWVAPLFKNSSNERNGSPGTIWGLISVDDSKESQRSCVSGARCWKICSLPKLHFDTSRN